MNISFDKDIVYDEAHALKLDIYRPEKMNGYGVIDIHGGGWFQGDKSKDEDWARLFAEKGYLVIVPNYRMAPDFRFPAARDDVIKAYDWLRGGPFALKGIAAVGSSAGGNLAIELALARGIPAVSWSGMIDVDHFMKVYADLAPVKNTLQNADKLASHQIDQGGPDNAYYKWTVLNYVGDDEEKLKEASVLHRITATAGPMLLINSMNEFSPTDAVIRLEQELVSKGVPVVTKLISGSRHAKGYLPQAQPYTYLFLEEFLGEATVII